MDFSQWVSDRVLSTLGISEPTIVDYMISAAKSCSSGEKLFQDLVKVADIPDNPQVHAFLTELVEKVPRSSKSSKSSERRKKHSEKTDILNRNMQFSLLNETEVEQEVKLVPHQTKKSFRKREIETEESEDESVDLEQEPQNSEKDLISKQEAIIQDDIRERDEFAARLKERDKLKTKNVTCNL